VQEEQKEPTPVEPELSKVWQELLGDRINSPGGLVQSERLSIPTLESDPWSELLQDRDVEVVDLQQLHLSDQDVEQMLEVIQEQPARTPEKNDNSTTHTQ
jgi:hypothetical protein